MHVETFSGGHFEVGQGIGTHYQERIQRALTGYAFLHDALLPYHKTPEGQVRYRRLMLYHEERYPEYLEELRGLAEGADVPFNYLFLINMRDEYRGYIQPDDDFGCSTCVLISPEAALLGHNEDGDPIFLGETYLVRIAVDGKIPFVAFCYPGFLPGNAFGANEAGVCFSINHVSPLHRKEGLARHFIARSLFEAETIHEAVSRATVLGRGAGFHYMIGSTRERRFASLEVAPEHYSLLAVQKVAFHANHYLRLPSVAQTMSPSSAARQRRGEAVLENNPPKDQDNLLALLQDKSNPEYPICRTAEGPDGSATLATALLDLDARTLSVTYPGDPASVTVQFAPA